MGLGGIVGGADFVLAEFNGPCEGPPFLSFILGILEVQDFAHDSTRLHPGEEGHRLHSDDYSNSV